MLITDILTRNARMYENETALVERAPAIDLRREITWKEFDEQADRTAQALMGLGIQKEDKVITLWSTPLNGCPSILESSEPGPWPFP